MKKLMMTLLIASLLAGCGSNKTSNKAPAAPTAFADGNNAGAINLETQPADMSNYVFLKDDNPAFTEITLEESFRLIEEKGTGCVYYSYETCPFCNRAIPTMDEAAKAMGITIFYVNLYSDTFMSKSKDEQNELVQKLYSLYEPALDHEKNENTGKEEVKMRVPLLVGVRDGEIVGHHRGITDDFELDQDKLDELQVTDKQKKELLSDYEKVIEDTYNG